MVFGDRRSWRMGISLALRRARGDRSSGSLPKALGSGQSSWRFVEIRWFSERGWAEGQFLGWLCFWRLCWWWICRPACSRSAELWIGHGCRPCRKALGLLETDGSSEAHASLSRVLINYYPLNSWVGSNCAWYIICVDTSEERRSTQMTWLLWLLLPPRQNLWATKLQIFLQLSEWHRALISPFFNHRLAECLACDMLKFNSDGNFAQLLAMDMSSKQVRASLHQETRSIGRNSAARGDLNSLHVYTFCILFVMFCDGWCGQSCLPIWCWNWSWMVERFIMISTHSFFPALECLQVRTGACDGAKINGFSWHCNSCGLA